MQSLSFDNAPWSFITMTKNKWKKPVKVYKNKCNLLLCKRDLLLPAHECRREDCPRRVFCLSDSLCLNDKKIITQLVKQRKNWSFRIEKGKLKQKCMEGEERVDTKAIATENPKHEADMNRSTQILRSISLFTRPNLVRKINRTI